MPAGQATGNMESPGSTDVHAGEGVSGAGAGGATWERVEAVDVGAADMMSYLRAFQSVALVIALDMAEVDFTLRFNVTIPTTIVNILLRLLASSNISSLFPMLIPLQYRRRVVTSFSPRAMPTHRPSTAMILLLSPSCDLL